MADVGDLAVDVADSFEAIPFREVLNDELVLEYVERLRACIDEHLSAEDGAMEYDGDIATPEELAGLRDSLEEIRAHYSTGATADGMTGWFAKSFFPRNRDLAFIQERLTECASRFVNEPPGGTLGPTEFDDEGPLPAVAGATFPRPSGASPEVFGPFEPCDARWAICLWNKLRKRPKHPFNAASASATLETHARLVIVGDWGSGVPRALALGEAIAERLDGENDGRDTHVVHLGDTYYVGSPAEQRDHVLVAWPRPEAVPIRSWAVPGNHDYYSGGAGFFNTLLADARFAEQRSNDGEPTSIFDIQNEHWRILGLDTAWKDHDLVDEEWDWLERTLEDASRRRQKVILLSHHQPYSAFAEPNVEFAKRALALVQRHPVEAWYWGHEHRCTIYESVPGIARPRCVGNGGVPEWVDTTTRPTVVADLQDPYIDPSDEETWRQFAYAVVDLDDDTFEARYVTETGTVWFNDPRTG